MQYIYIRKMMTQLLKLKIVCLGFLSITQPLLLTESAKFNRLNSFVRLLSLVKFSPFSINMLLSSFLQSDYLNVTNVMLKWLINCHATVYLAANQVHEEESRKINIKM